MYNLLPNNLLTACAIHNAIEMRFGTFNPVVTFPVAVVAVFTFAFFSTLCVARFITALLGDQHSSHTDTTVELDSLDEYYSTSKISEWRIDPIYDDVEEGQQQFINTYDHIQPRSYSTSSTSSSSGLSTARGSRTTSPVPQKDCTKRSMNECGQVVKPVSISSIEDTSEVLMNISS